MMLSAKNKTGLVFFPAFDWAIDPTHPEREERLLYTQDQVFEEGVLDIDGIVELKPDLVTLKDITLFQRLSLLPRNLPLNRQNRQTGLLLKVRINPLPESRWP